MKDAPACGDHALSRNGPDSPPGASLDREKASSSGRRSRLRAGVGLKPAHYRTILDEKPKIDFFEIHAENFMGSGGPPHRYLTEIRSHYALSVHGVGLSLGGSGPLDGNHLERLCTLVDRYRPVLVSEHLAWSSHAGAYFGDLLPLPYTANTLARAAAHVDQVQDTLGRRILVENPSTYLRHAGSTLSESEFLDRLAERTGCGLLLDVNNLYVSAINHCMDPVASLEAFPIGYAGQIHLAGHTPETDEHGGPLLIDTHDRAVAEAVWELYRLALLRAGALPTLIEWDADLPPWEVLQTEALRAAALIDDRCVLEATTHACI